MFFPECEIYAETEIGSGMIDGNELFGIFGGKIVCAEKQVEARCAYVENGSHGATHIETEPLRVMWSADNGRKFTAAIPSA